VNRLERELDLPAAEARAALADAADALGGEWSPEGSGGRLVLPVVFGLRRGVAIGRVEVVRLGESRSRIEWTLEESRLHVERASVAVLSLAAVPLVGSIAWPFWPVLFPLVPFAAIFGLLAWWLVISRLRHFGPEELLRGLAPAPPREGERQPGNPGPP
jgi:hypothetical protein